MVQELLSADHYRLVISKLCTAWNTSDGARTVLALAVAANGSVRDAAPGCLESGLPG
jgi:hypothetical protein